MNPEFDCKLGPSYLSSVPARSGVYIWKDEAGLIVYIGKAKNLKKRLSQYRLATRRKQHRKMRLVVKKASAIELHLCDSEQAALLLENKLIQQHRPALNIAGAYSFMYPYIGFKRDVLQPQSVIIACSSSPEQLLDQGFMLFGAFRSRQIVTEAFEALVKLLSYLGHKTPSETKKIGPVPYTRMVAFRQLDATWIESLILLADGRSMAFIGELALTLLEKPKARQMASEVEEYLKKLQMFFYAEARKLRSALDSLGLDGSYVPQTDRDSLFLQLNGEST